MHEKQGLDRRSFLKFTGLGAVATACGAVAALARFFPYPAAQAAPAAASGSEQASAAERLFAGKPSDPEYENQIVDFAQLADGSEQGYLSAIQRYKELYLLAHPNYIYDPNNPNTDPLNCAFILGGGIGNTVDGPVDKDTVIIRGTAAHTYSRDWNTGGGDIRDTFTVYASNNISNNMIGPFAVSNNGRGMCGISPFAGVVVPGVIKTESDTTSLRQTKALEAAISWVAKDSKGITVVVVAGEFTDPSDILVKAIKKAADKGVIIVLAPGSTLSNHPDIAPNVIIAGSSDGQNAGTTDVMLPGQMWGYLNPVDINQVSGSHIPVAQMATIIQMARGLEKEREAQFSTKSIPPILVAEMKTLIRQYGVDAKGNFVHLQGFLDAVAVRYGLIEAPTPTPTIAPTLMSTDVLPTTAPTVTPSAIPTHTTTPTVKPTPQKTPTSTPSPEPPKEHHLYLPLVSQAISGLLRFFR